MLERAFQPMALAGIRRGPPGVRVIVRAGRLVLGQMPAEELRDCLPRLVFSEPGQVGNLVDNGFYQALNTLVCTPF